MILTSKTILKKIEGDELMILPFTSSQVQPAFINLRLGSHFIIMDEYSTSFISLEKPPSYKEVCQETIMIPPQGLVIGTTVEYINLPPNLIGFVQRRNSIGGIGLCIQNTGWIEPGFEGHIALEIYNANLVPIELKAGSCICQLVIAQLDQKCTAYMGRYNDSKRTTESQIFLKDCKNSDSMREKFKEFD
jgi:dCTP deaminase